MASCDGGGWLGAGVSGGVGSGDAETRCRVCSCFSGASGCCRCSRASFVGVAAWEDCWAVAAEAAVAAAAAEAAAASQRASSSAACAWQRGCQIPVLTGQCLPLACWAVCMGHRLPG